MTIGVLALQGDFREHANMTSALGVDVRLIRLPEDLTGVDGLIVPGGESTTMGKLMQSFGLDQAITERFNSGTLAIYGTCAGMILLASEIQDRSEQPRLGFLDVTVRRNAFGRQKESSEEDLAIEGLDSPFHAIFIRAPVIIRTGPQVKVLAAVSEGPVCVQQGRILASSFHPELGTDTRIHEHFLRLAEQSHNQEV
ncbi:MAG TPA: pyridoxal 5'-phosphate synthase glutaminase subunit PdxT [Candidatus Cryosericum sp.]|nr:pyridoxal 5'-phosphate synthase glutaminase subunit PdxT [Candidatus Cryosericum sp.]